jgi:hypothetical protein
MRHTRSVPCGRNFLRGKRPNIETKETYYKDKREEYLVGANSLRKRDLLQRQKRPTTETKET